MKKSTSAITTSLFLLLSNVGPLSAQTMADIQALSGSFSVKKNKKEYPFAQAQHENEYVWALAKAFLFYKKNISSQDLNACNFHPSCSEYAMISVRELGPLKGILNGFDRLTRCHPGARTYYQPDPILPKFSDPFIPLR
jgi:uncharacterized protein